MERKQSRGKFSLSLTFGEKVAPSRVTALVLRNRLSRWFGFVRNCARPAGYTVNSLGYIHYWVLRVMDVGIVFVLPSFLMVVALERAYALSQPSTKIDADTGCENVRSIEHPKCRKAVARDTH